MPTRAPSTSGPTRRATSITRTVRRRPGASGSHRVQAAPSAADVEQARQRLEKLLAEQEQSAAVRLEERLERQRKQAAAIEQAAARKRICIMAQQNLHALLMQRPVYYIDEKGERMFLDDASHKAEIERMRELITQYCDSD